MWSVESIFFSAVSDFFFACKSIRFCPHTPDRLCRTLRVPAYFAPKNRGTRLSPREFDSDRNRGGGVVRTGRGARKYRNPSRFSSAVSKNRERIDKNGFPFSNRPHAHVKRLAWRRRAVFYSFGFHRTVVVDTERVRNKRWARATTVITCRVFVWHRGKRL